MAVNELEMLMRLKGELKCVVQTMEFVQQLMKENEEKIKKQKIKKALAAAGGSKHTYKHKVTKPYVKKN